MGRGVYSFGTMISRIIALRNMELVDHKGNPVPFDVQFVTADRARKTGGAIEELKGVVLSNAKRKKKPQRITAAMPDDLGDRPNGKRPNHYVNRTRNFMLPNNQVRKAHISLITHMNGEVVL